MLRIFWDDGLLSFRRNHGYLFIFDEYILSSFWKSRSTHVSPSWSWIPDKHCVFSGMTHLGAYHLRNCAASTPRHPGNREAPHLRHPGNRAAIIRDLGEMMKAFCVYMLANKRNGTVYTGVTSDLIKRIWQHKSGEIAGFTQKYNVKILVYYEQFDNAESAIEREKQLKKWKRKWKLALIEKNNPAWRDLYNEILT